jgi:SOS-response transcriptional repressor LexA
MAPLCAPSPRQRAVYDAMVAHMGDHAEPPTIREIAAAVGTSAPNVMARVQHLARSGWLQKVGAGARCWHPVDAFTVTLAPATARRLRFEATQSGRSPEAVIASVLNEHYEFA